MLKTIDGYVFGWTRFRAYDPNRTSRDVHWDVREARRRGKGSFFFWRRKNVTRKIYGYFNRLVAF